MNPANNSIGEGTASARVGPRYPRVMRRKANIYFYACHGGIRGSTDHATGDLRATEYTRWSSRAILNVKYKPSKLRWPRERINRAEALAGLDAPRPEVAVVYWKGESAALRACIMHRGEKTFARASACKYRVSRGPPPVLVAERREQRGARIASTKQIRPRKNPSNRAGAPATLKLLRGPRSAAKDTLDFARPGTVAIDYRPRSVDKKNYGAHGLNSHLKFVYTDAPAFAWVKYQDGTRYVRHT